VEKNHRAGNSDTVKASRIGLPSRECERAVSLSYLITFTCYGAHVHGDESGTVDHEHNLPGSRLLNPDPIREGIERQLMQHRPYLLDRTRRALVLKSLHEVCSHRGWHLLAAHVRMNHVHIVVEADTRPEKIMTTFKIYASRILNLSGMDGPGCKRWARHGSTRYLWNQKNVSAAIKYVLFEQGSAMEIFEAEEWLRLPA
jgi:REP element-mobilizing transposase RayT